LINFIYNEKFTYLSMNAPVLVLFRKAISVCAELTCCRFVSAVFVLNNTLSSFRDRLNRVIAMSYVCYICKELINGGTRSLFSHLRSAHFVCELRNVTLRCGQGDCVRCYTSFNSLARHLRNEHPNIEAADRSVEVNDANVSVTDDHCDVEIREADSVENVSREPFDINSTAAAFVASLFSSSSVTQKNVQSVIEHTTSLVGDIVANISTVVSSSLANVNASSLDMQHVQNTILQYAEPFKMLNSQHKREKYFHKKFGMVKARSILLGNHYDQVMDPASGAMRQIIKRDTFQYVPLLKLLALLLSDAGIRDATDATHHAGDGYMQDFCDGSLFENIPLFVEDKTALQLCMYFDECEVVNPLGSRKGIHKIGFIYLSLWNLHPVVRSRLNNIHILAAFNSIDRVKYGFGKILAPIVKDLKELERGVDLKLHDDTFVHKRGTLIQIVGDNLGLNQLCGFVESFSALHFCRLCMSSKDVCNVVCKDDVLEMRNKQQYLQQLCDVVDGKLTTKECGIKSSCKLNELQYFHTVDNVTVDIMHDVLEGVAPYELKLILFSFVYEKKYFSLQLLNSRLASLNYGYIDRRNKPTALSEAELKDQQRNGLSQKAAQMFCLLIVLPFVVGAEVPHNDKMWHLFLLLRDIIDIIFADMCTVADSVILRHKVEDHHCLFKSVFPQKHLLPKHHMMLHYPHVMRKVGTLCRCSSMRFEAKHYETKRLCSVVCCFKDICKTVVQRHQLNQCVQVTAGQMSKYTVSVDTVHVNMINELPDAELILSAVAGVKGCDDISHADTVKVCGTEYRKNMVIAVAVDDEPTFCRITRCLICLNDDVYFVCQNMQIAHYDTHLHAYAVRAGDGMCVVNQRCLKYFKPLSVHQLFDTCQDFIVFPQ